MDEVLVATRDLVNDRSVTVDHTRRAVTYVHILLPRHNIIWADGVETESFHPDAAMLDPQQRVDLSYVLADPQGCGEPAQCTLSTAEAPSCGMIRVQVLQAGQGFNAPYGQG